MNIGIPKEIRPSEYRVGLSPAGVQALTGRGHTVYVEHDAGRGAGFSDHDYEKAGGRIAYSAHEVYARADYLTKIGRPLQEEIEWLQDGVILAGLLQLPSARQKKISTLLEKNITAIAYELIQRPDGSRPMLKVSSQIGGRMTAQIAARFLQNDHGGKGILLGGMPGVPPAEVVIIGAGTVGLCAARAFQGLGAHLTILDNDIAALQYIQDNLPNVVTLMSSPTSVARSVAYADVVVSTVMIPGQRAPLVVTREMVSAMKPRSLIIDVSIDQGGSVETSRPTTHENPTFVEEGVIHYCVPNIPGVAARTATHAFVNAALPFILQIADLGVDTALAQTPGIEAGIATQGGELRHLSLLSPKEEG